MIEPRPINTNYEKNRMKNKRNKKRFIENAKGFGKKGIYGRGTVIKDDQFTYFINILDTMKHGFETMEDKVTMANNVFEQTVEEEIHLSSNQIVSKVIEALVGFTNAENFERFQDIFATNFRPICSDQYASHVLQKMIEIAFLRAITKKDEQEESDPPNKKKKSDALSEKEYNATNKFSKDHKEKCSSFLLKIGKFLLNNLEDFIWDPYANQIMRTSILCLSGIHNNKVAFQHGNDKINYDRGDYYDVSEEWLDIVKEYVHRLQLWPQFSEFPYNELSSGLIGTICVALRKIDKNSLKHLGKKMLFESFISGNDSDDKKKIEIKDDDDDDADKTEEKKQKEEHSLPVTELPKVFQTSSSIRLLETLLTVAGKKLFTQLYAFLFTGRIKSLALDRKSNFAVQKLLENMKEKVDFEAIFEEISANLEELLRVGHTGVVFGLCAACRRLSTKQGTFLTAVQNAFHVTKANLDSLFMCILKLKPYEIAAEDKTQFIHLHGSLIVQSILHFNKPIVIVNCILNTPPNDLLLIFSTPNGSHVADAFMESKFIGEKSREKLIRHFDGYYVEMAITKFGSFILEKLFEAASDGQKSKIAKELVDKMNQLNGTIFGRLLCKKFRLETYRLSSGQWKAAFDKADKAEKLFKDILQK